MLHFSDMSVFPRSHLLLPRFINDYVMFSLYKSYLHIQVPIVCAWSPSVDSGTPDISY